MLEVGEHTFEVRAVDVSGNVDPSAASHAWTIEPRPPFTPPVTTIHSGPDHTTTATDADFEFSADERLVDFKCALNSPLFVDCSWVTWPSIWSARGTVHVGGLAPGVHQFKVQASDRDLDEFGNAAPNVGTEAIWSWQVMAPPTPAEVTCGEILVESIRLENDLVDCEGNGLVIGRAGITIDLNGHIIDGVGIDSGILNPGFDGTTITNGTMTQFDYGVQLGAGTGRSVVSELRLEDNQEAGAALADADQDGHGNTVRRNTIVNNFHGIALYSGTRGAVLVDNALGGNNGDGIRSEHSKESRIERNEIHRLRRRRRAVRGRQRQRRVRQRRSRTTSSASPSAKSCSARTTTGSSATRSAASAPASA